MRGKKGGWKETVKRERREGRRQLTGGLFKHEIRLSDEKQGGNRDRDSRRASGKEKA